ncbi:MAG TPA: 8-amino-7-oxononanoate synthase [Candidatus Binataceae bacterium]|nr:8-amino-7-oxononanoate synthase [Candidatus Binataceae bacterium]
MRILDAELTLALDRLEQEALRRRLRVIESAHGAEVEFNGRRMLMFSSNNYLDLAAHPAVKRAAVEAVERYGVGAAASRLVAGSIEPIHRLEQNLARFKKVEAALVFGSGYLANMGAITSLTGPGDVVFSDELNHASLVDGCRLSKAAVKIFRHREVAHLRALLEEPTSAKRRLIVTDSVFSMDGDFAPLSEIVELAREFNAAVMIDEAHGVGMVGPRGAGLAAELSLENEIDVQVGTLSKALGAQGAYVAGSRALIDFLINRARCFIYTTGLPPAIAAAADAALKVMIEEPERLVKLHDNAAYLRTALIAAGFTLAPTTSSILPVMMGSAQNALKMAERLFARGVYVIAIRPPTVPQGSARLRVTPTAGHSRADLDRAVAAFIESGRELRLI